MASPSDTEPLSQNAPSAFLGGCYEISLDRQDVGSALDVALPITVTYTTPSGVRLNERGYKTSQDCARSRIYLSEAGHWKWEAKTINGKGIQSGSFHVQSAHLPGKLRVSREDSRQFRFSNTEPFLHIGTGALRLLAPEETRWQACIDQASQAGFSKLRVCLPSADNSAANFYDAARKGLNYAFWDEADKRLSYALSRHPYLQIQLNICGQDRQELERYEEGDPLTHLAIQYLVQRFGQLPNVQWSLADAINPGKDNAVVLQALSRLGKYVFENTPGDTLITCGQDRFGPFLFDREKWCSLSSLCTLGEVTGEVAKDQRAKTSKPIVVDEDRSEHSNAPNFPRYYFRRLCWGLLLSGAHPSYEGLNTRLPSAAGHKSGIHGYYDACHASRLRQGAHDLLHIRSFFKQLGVNLENWVPDDHIGGSNPLLVKAMRSPDSSRAIVYVANPDSHGGHSGKKGQGLYTDAFAHASEIFTTFNLELPFPAGKARWYSPSSGTWHGEVELGKSSTTLLTPEPGDWILWISRC